MIRPLPNRWFAARFVRRLFLTVGVIILAAAATVGAAEKTGSAEPDFEAAVQMVPFVVHGNSLSLAIHARTPSDRRYAQKFAEEVIEVAYETLGKSTGSGLVIIGREGEPHPLTVIRKFLALAEAGQLDPSVVVKPAELDALMRNWKTMTNLEVDPEEKGFKITFEMIVPALPLPLEGVAAKLYQISWAEDFDDARVEQKLRSLTAADFKSDSLSKYDWVFYLPPRNAYVGVQNDIIKQAVKHEKMGLFKRAALKSALVVFKSTIKAMVEAMRKSVLFMTVLRARSDYSLDDIQALSTAYLNVLMPDFKFNGGSEHRRVLEAIERQKIQNAEYAKDPFVSPPRLATFDPAAYAPFEGGYAPEKEKPTRSLTRKDDTYLWQSRKLKPQVFYPAGERLLVSADGKWTLEFQIDAQGAVTGVEVRGVRQRTKFPRSL